jgi:hypothetical protein
MSSEVMLRVSSSSWQLAAGSWTSSSCRGSRGRKRKRNKSKRRKKRRVMMMTPLPPQTLSTRGTGRGGDTAVGQGQIDVPLQLLRGRQRLVLVGRRVAGHDSLTGLGAAAGAREGNERAGMNLGGAG